MVNESVGEAAGDLPRRRVLGIGLRARSMVAFAAVALVLSASLALLSYDVTRRNLLVQREAAAERQTYLNARLVRSVLRNVDADIPELLSSLQLGSNGAAVLRVGDKWFGTDVGLDRDDVPDTLARVVSDGSAGRQIARVSNGGPFVAVGVPIVAANSSYFEFVSLEELDDTLATLATVLTVAAVGTTAAGAVAGLYASGRVLRPVRRMAATAAGIGAGRLDQRLDAGRDPDLEPLVESFNAMVDALQARLEREARFASDVSHELRAPLAAMSSALSVARRHASDGATEALTVLGQKIEDFNQLVSDLLEISRLEAGVAVLAVDPVDPEELLQGVISSTGKQGVDVSVEQGTPSPVPIDQRRVAQMLRNLMENADRYAGGPVALKAWSGPGRVFFAVEDRGPGVPEHERAYIFERFARGERADESTPGTGLGLALVAEHARLHGGQVSVEDAAPRGARFVIELPIEGDR